MAQELIQAIATLPSSDKDKQKIEAAIKEISDCMTRIDSEKDLVKDIATALNDDYGLPKRLVNKMATVYHKGNLQEVNQQAEEFDLFYEAVMVK